MTISGIINNKIYQVSYICKSCGEVIKKMYSLKKIPEYVKGGYCRPCHKIIETENSGKGAPDEKSFN